MASTGTPEGMHPDDIEGDEWKNGGQSEPEPEPTNVQYEQPEEILTGDPKQFMGEVPRMKELQGPPVEEMARTFQRLKEILHEEVGEMAKVEAICAWVSIMDRCVMSMKDELGPRLKTFFDTHGTKDLPFTIDTQIPGWVRASYMTRVNMELADLAKKEYGTNIFREPLLKSQ